MGALFRMLGEREATDRVYRALGHFRDTGVSEAEHVGALIEALGLYCEEQDKRIADNSGPRLWMRAIEHSRLLYSKRCEHDPESIRERIETERAILLSGILNSGIVAE